MSQETRSIQVAPSEEQSTIELYQLFGWELKSSQEIFNQSSHLERDGDSINQVTTTTNYVKLVFQRDTEMKNYRELADLERQYEGVAFPMKKKTWGWFLLGAAAICASEGVIANVGGGVGMLLGVAAVAGGIALIVFGFMKKSKYKKEYQAAYAEAASRRNEIVNAARALAK